MTRKALVLAHYNRSGDIRKDTLDALRVLHEYFDKILLVSTNFDLRNSHVIPDFVELHVRENVGYDFYSYRLGIKRLLCESQDWQITLMNTSFVMIDPRVFFESYIKKSIQSRNFDAFGLTKSQEKQVHLQSFLLTFSEQVVKDAEFAAWWDAMTPIDVRQQVIDSYELGLSQHLSRLGYRLDAKFDSYGPIWCWQRKFGDFLSVNVLWKFLNHIVERLRQANRVRRKGVANPSHAYYENLLDNFGVLKIEVFKANPYDLNLARIDRMMGESEEFKRIITDGLNN